MYKKLVSFLFFLLLCGEPACGSHCPEHGHSPMSDFPMMPVGGNIIINNYGSMHPIFIASPAPVHVAIASDGTPMLGGGSPIYPYQGASNPLNGGAKPTAGPFRWQWMNNCHQCWNSFVNGVRMHAMRAPSLYAYIKENKWSLALKSALGVYVVINCMLFRMVSFLTAPQRWMYWRNDILLLQLMRMSSTDLIQELLASLSLRTQMPPDQTPIQLLFAELDDEICQLQCYNRWVETINKLSTIQNYCALSAEAILPSFLGVPLGYMTRVALSAINLKNICYINQELVQHTPEHLRRLMYLRRILEEELAVDLPQVITETVEVASP